MRRAQQGVFPVRDDLDQALAWEVHKGREAIIDKFGGMDNAAAYIGLMPEQKVGIVILGNRGNMAVWETGRSMLRALALR